MTDYIILYFGIALIFYLFILKLNELCQDEFNKILFFILAIGLIIGGLIN